MGKGLSVQRVEDSTSGRKIVIGMQSLSAVWNHSMSVKFVEGNSSKNEV